MIVVISGIGVFAEFCPTLQKTEINLGTSWKNHGLFKSKDLYNLMSFTTLNFYF